MKTDFLISNIPTGKLNAMVKNIMAQTGITEPEEVVRMINSGELQVLPTESKWIEKDGVIRFSVTSDGTTGEQWVKRLEKKNVNIGSRAKKILLSSYFKQNNNFVYDVVILKGELFSEEGRTYRNILREADNRKLLRPPVQLVCLIREKFSDKDLEDMGLCWIAVMHKNIENSEFSSLLLTANRSFENSLDDYAIPHPQFEPKVFPYKTFGFAFIAARRLKA